MEQKIRKRIFDIAIVLLIVAPLYACLYLFRIPCPIRMATGVSCAGCGMTRAYLSLFHGNIPGAFHYHPLFLLPPFAVVWICFEPKIPKHVYRIVFAIGLVAYIGVYIYRLLTPNDVIVIAPQDGYYVRVLMGIKEIVKTVFG